MNSCKDCRFCKLQLAADKVGQYFCRRNPPNATGQLLLKPGGVMQTMTLTSWPIVKETDWCGEFQPDVKLAS